MRHDPIDPARSPGTERPLPLTEAERESRMREAGFGRCETCGAALPRVRLTERPAPRRCPACQGTVARNTLR